MKYSFIKQVRNLQRYFNTSRNRFAGVAAPYNKPPNSLGVINYGPVMVRYGNDAAAGPFWIRMLMYRIN